MRAHQPSNIVNETIALDVDGSFPLTSGADVDLRVVKSLRLNPGESRGYWVQNSSQKRHGQTIVYGAVNDLRTRILLDSGGDTSIIDTDFVRELGIKVDETQTMSGVGVESVRSRLH